MLNRDPGCTSCELHQSCKTVCIPTVLSRRAFSCWRYRQALLVVGKYPGRKEDLQGVPFVGRSGACWEHVYLASMKEFSPDTDIYLTNAIRCYPGATEIKPKHLKACRRFLEADIQALAETYERVTILALGAEGCRQVFGGGVAKCLRRQGEIFRWDHGVETPALATYHPAYIDGYPGNRNQKTHLIASVAGHLSLVERVLNGEEIRIVWAGSKLRVNCYPSEVLDVEKS